MADNTKDRLYVGEKGRMDGKESIKNRDKDFNQRNEEKGKKSRPN
ncbi:general stress protein B [Niallia sp. XMNu-256]